MVGEREETLCAALSTGPVNWVSRSRPATSMEIDVQIRHRHRPVPGTLEPLADERCRVAFRDPVESPAPGQAAVLYDGDWVAGGGWIQETEPATETVA